MMQKKLPSALAFLLFLLLMALICMALFGIAQRYGAELPTAPTINSAPAVTVVLDAGHGGEDGGAVSASGLCEKDINLEITLLLRDLLTANGVNVILTRESDVLLYDRSSLYQGHKKEQDLATRRRIAEETENAVLISIHMNSFPQTQYHGLQVWYSPNHTDSAVLAQRIQQTAASLLQPENERRIKQAGDNIYLLHHLSCPAVLVECGFLSNPGEAERLGDAGYQKELAFSIFLAVMQSLTPS